MPEPQRLLFVSHEMTLSGAPIQLAYLVNWLQAHGCLTTVLAPEEGPLAEMLPGIEIIYESQLLIDPAYGALRRWIRNFDAIIANTVATWEAVQAAHLEGIPAIWYLHETEVGVQLMSLVQMIEPSLRLADAVVTPTAATARVYADFVPGEIAVIPYGIPEAMPRSSARGSTLEFAIIGTYEARKGQDVLLEAVERLAPEIRDRTNFHFAGRVLEEAFYDRLRERSGSLLNVHFGGALGHEEAMTLLGRADVLVCPSRDETMPIVLLEAMSLGKAIICTDVGGISEWLRDGRNGLVVAPENSAALTDAIERVVRDPELIANLGRAARETFARHFTIEQYGQRFAQLIRKTIAARGKSA